jgi:DUF1365 family protein
VAIREKFLCYAWVMHKRLRPSINSFFYQVFYICFDIKKIDSLCSIFFSINKFNFFSLYFKDHGNKDGSTLEGWIRKILAEENLNEKTKKINPSPVAEKTG